MCFISCNNFLGKSKFSDFCILLTWFYLYVYLIQYYNALLLCTYSFFYFVLLVKPQTYVISSCWCFKLYWPKNFMVFNFSPKNNFVSALFFVQIWEKRKTNFECFVVILTRMSMQHLSNFHWTIFFEIVIASLLILHP